MKLARLLRFGLLLSVLGLCLYFFLKPETKGTHRLVLESIAELGGNKAIDYMEDGSMIVTIIPPAETITDDDLPKLKSLEPFDHLYLPGARKITDQGMKSIAQLKGLKSLTLNKTSISDHGLEYLKDMPNLDHLSLMFCKNISNAGIAHLKSMKNLKFLYLDGCHLDDTAVDSFSEMSDLVNLSVADSGMTAKGIRKLKEKQPHLAVIFVTEED